MSYTEQLERETEQTRQQLADTLEEMRARITPGQVMDQLVDYASDNSGGEFLRNLKRQAVRNPLPVTLIGAGLAWLMFSNGRSSGIGFTGRAKRKFGEAADDMSDTLSSAGDSVARGGSEVADRARSTATVLADRAEESQAGIGDAARSAASSASDKMSSTYDTAASAYDNIADKAAQTAASVAGSARTFGRGAATTSRSFVEFCRDQPLVLAGIGVALGAAAGAILPPTEREDRVMGKTSDNAKEELKDLASETYDKAKAVGERAVEAAQDEAEKQGLTTTTGRLEKHTGLADEDQTEFAGEGGSAQRQDRGLQDPWR